MRANVTRAMFALAVPNRPTDPLEGLSDCALKEIAFYVARELRQRNQKGTQKPCPRCPHYTVGKGKK